MNFIKSLLKGIILISIVIFSFSFYHYHTDLKVRKELKKECFGETCPCFYNITDYRLTKEQAKIFLMYLQNRKFRPETKIMEFTDFYDAQKIMEAYSVCQLEQVKDSQKVEVETTQKEDSNSTTNESEETTPTDELLEEKTEEQIKEGDIQ